MHLQFVFQWKRITYTWYGDGRQAEGERKGRDGQGWGLKGTAAGSLAVTRDIGGKEETDCRLGQTMSEWKWHKCLIQDIWIFHKDMTHIQNKARASPKNDYSVCVSVWVCVCARKSPFIVELLLVCMVIECVCVWECVAAWLSACVRQFMILWANLHSAI